MTIDVILVKHTPTKMHEESWNRTLAHVNEWDCGVLIHDNNIENIGLTKARNLLLEKSEADIVVLMDYDFLSLIHI